MQLVDEYGDEITSNQYLENALENQDGFDHDTEFKNKIRELIKVFFQKRSCVTLVRPLTSEEGLNKLNECKLENLRPEFVEEALKLRNSMLLNAKIKMIENKPVNGEILGGILRAYIDTINSGVIPNIENTWTYVTQNQAMKLLDKCIQEFKGLVNTQLRKTIPTDARILKAHIQEFQGLLIREFQENSFLTNEENVQYQTTLIEKIKDEKKKLLAENDQQFENVLLVAMNNNYKENVYQNVLNDKILEFRELVNVLKNFRSTFESIEPDGPRKLERVYKFLFSKSCESFSILCHNANTRFVDQLAEKNRELKLNEEKLAEELKNVTDLKSKSESENKGLETRFQDLHFENEKLNENLKFVKEEMTQLELDQTNRREEEKSIYKKKNEELLKKIELGQQNYKVLESNFSKQKSDFQIELALLNQKIEFYINTEQDLNDQKNKLINRQKKAEIEFNTRLAKAIQDFEIRLKEKTDEINQLRETKYSIEDELKLKQNYNQSMCSEFVDKEDELHKNIQGHEKTIQQLKAQVQACENLSAAQTHQEQTLLERITTLEMASKANEEKLREKEEKLSALGSSMDTILAVEQQKLHFLELKVAELSAENEDLRKRKDSNLQLLEIKNLPKVDLNSQLQEVRTNYEERLKKIQMDVELEKEEMSKQHNKTIEENELRIKELKTEKESLFGGKLALTQEIESARQKLKSLDDKIKSMETSQSFSSQEKVSFYESQIKKLSEEKDVIQTQKEDEQEKARRGFEEHLINMQVVFEGEKHRLDSRLAEEKLKYELLLTEHSEELEKKRAEEVAQVEEENEYLNLELQSQELKTKSIVQKLEVEISNLKTKLELAERKAAELANNIDKEMTREKNKARLSLVSVEQERVLLGEKLNGLKSELTSKSLELFQLKQQSDSQATSFAKNLAEKVKEAEDLNSEINEFKAKVEAGAAEKYSMSEDLINTKISLNKDLALKTQKVEFLENKIADLIGNLETLQKETDEKLRSVKLEIDQEKDNVNKSKREEISLWESRYEEKKKAMKEIEAIFSAKVNELEKTKYILQEKLAAAELKRDEYEKKNQIDVLKFENDLRKLKDSYLNERREMIAEIDMLRKEKYELEISLAETHAKLDKDKAVFESKVSFLELQIRKLKTDLGESQSSFDAMFQKFHQFRVSDKEETENSHNSYVIGLEQRYTAQIQDLKDQHRLMNDSYKEKVKTYEKEIKRLEQLNYEHMNNRHGSGLYQEKKISEMLEAEKQLQDELVRVKASAERTNMQGQKEFDKEREVFKKKMLDQELRLKKLETEKNLMIFEQEKQKTKWNIEKDHLISSKTEFLESLDRLKKQKDQMNRENDKLKTDLRMVKKTSMGNSLFTFVKNRSDVFSVDKSQRSSNEYLGTNQKNSNIYRDESDGDGN